MLHLKAVDDDSVTKEPRELYEWAKLFKATSWEEIKMLAEKNEYIADTVVTLKELSDDEKIKMQAEARWRYEHDIASYIGQGREEGKLEEKEDNIRKLAEHYLKEDISLTEERALEKARAILL